MNKEREIKAHPVLFALKLAIILIAAVIIATWQASQVAWGRENERRKVVGGRFGCRLD